MELQRLQGKSSLFGNHYGTHVNNRLPTSGRLFYYRAIGSSLLPNRPRVRGNPVRSNRYSGAGGWTRTGLARLRFASAEVGLPNFILRSLLYLRYCCLALVTDSYICHTALAVNYRVTPTLL